MNMNGTGNQNSQHNSREAWPGEREPGRSDAELAYQHINDAFITSFKAAIPIPTRIDGYVEYLRTGTLNPLLVAENRPVRFLELQSELLLTMCCCSYTGQLAILLIRRRKITAVQQYRLQNM